MFDDIVHVARRPFDKLVEAILAVQVFSFSLASFPNFNIGLSTSMVVPENMFWHVHPGTWHCRAGSMTGTKQGSWV